MRILKLFSKKDAPAEAAPILEKAEAEFGFTPNYMGVMAASPALLRAYTALEQVFASSSLSPGEQQLVALVASYEHDCPYCLPAHSEMAAREGITEEVIEAIREGRGIENPRFQALRRFTSRIIETRGQVTDDEVDGFCRAGYTKAQALEVILGVGLKTLSNFTNRLAETPLDPAFAHRARKRDA
ncbi:MAG: carboxymuconolactone decarboxylase family protein [Myxococcales bacterium]|nr:carboxymuconolactone decarboxylase family protein [Myxococcales bacterium]